MIDRRAFAGGTLAGMSALAAPAILSRAAAHVLRGRDPFPFSVASGDPSAHGMILWTRLARATDDPTPVSRLPVEVEWLVASDPALGKVVARGAAQARPDNGFSVHVDVRGLESDRFYWYVFRLGGVDSPIGRTRTLPHPAATVGRFRFNVASCQNWENGFFDAYDGMAGDDAAFVLHLGDYIYDTNRGGVRRHIPDTTPTTLADYRARHALYRNDAALRRAHETLPFVVVPDNHDALEWDSRAPRDLARRAAAYQAWAEFMPSRCALHRTGVGLAIARTVTIGSLLRLVLLDTRQFRASHDICQEISDPAFAYGIYRRPCDQIEAGARSMLGIAQEAWLEQQWRGSPAAWNALATTVMLTRFDLDHDGALYRYLAAWDGFPANRDRILSMIERRALANPISLSGDIHSSLVSTVARRERGGEPKPCLTEFVGTSISSIWPEALAAPMREALPRNRHVTHFDPTRRGYMRCTVTASTWTTDLRIIDTTAAPGGRSSTDRSFVVESGRVGANPA